MSIRDNIHEWIDTYLNNEMSEGERLAFENQLKSDQEFARIFEAQKISHQIVVGQELVKLKAQMSKDLGSGNIGGSSKVYWKYLASGVVAVATLAIIYFLMQPEEEKAPVIQNQPAISPDSGKVNSDKQIESSDKEDETSIKDNPLPAPPSVNDQNKTCTDTLISFSCQARAACLDQDNGAIEVDINTIKSGKAPYAFSTRPEGEFTTEGIIRDLKPGIYNLYVKDAGECVRKLNVKVEIPEIKCDPKN